MGVFLIIAFFILLFGGIVAIIFAFDNGLVAGVVSLLYAILLLSTLIVDEEYERQNTVDKIGSGQATIDTVYTIQNRDTIKTEYKLIQINNSDK